MANKALTIKGASDEELEALRRRLQNENEVARLIADLRCRSNGSNAYATNPYEGISTEVPIDDLYHSEAADKVLAHYGILGMKWGKRKAKSVTNPSEDHKRAQSLKGKKISEMSNSELRDLTQRLQLERQYKDLKKSEISEGQKLVSGILKDIGRDMLKEAIRSGVKAGSKASSKALKNKLNK